MRRWELNRGQHIQEVTILNRKFEKKYYPKVEKAIRGQIDEIKKVIEIGGIVQGINEVNKIISSPAATIVEQLYQEVGLRYARRTWRSLSEQKRTSKKPKRVAKDWGVPVGGVINSANRGQTKTEPLVDVTLKGFGFNAVWVQFLKNTLYRFLIEKVMFDAAETTRKVLLNVLSKSIEEGWGIEKTLKELDELPLSRTQAARIVRTEVTRAANTGAMAAGETFEYEQQKEWISARDVRTRGVNPEDHASHVGLNGQVVDYDQPFTDPRNGDKLMFPGDPKAKAESTVNCRCAVAVTAKYDANGRLIPKNK